MDLEAQKKALFDLMLAEEGFSAEPSPSANDGTIIEPRDSQLHCPLSFAQQRLWFLDQLNPGNPAYNVPGVLNVEGELSITALEQCIEKIVARHEVLRTQFIESDEGPIQKVLNPNESKKAFDFIYENLCQFPPEAQKEKLEAHIEAEMTHRFDLKTGPLLRARLLSLQPNQHRLLFTLHHIVCDEQSLTLLAEELVAHYTAITQNQPLALSDLKIHYGDYSAWQRDWAKSNEHQKQLEYWSKQLADLEPTELPTDKPRPVTPSYSGQKTSFTLAPSIKTQVEAFAQAHATTPFIVLLTAFKHLLYRHTHQTDLAIGTPVANRDKAQTEKLIGFFTNTLVIRSQLNAATTFESLLETVKTQCTASFSHQDLPFESLVESLQPDRSLNRNPFFEILFVLQTAFDTVQLPGAQLTLQPHQVKTIKFDFTFTLKESDNGYEGWIEYNSDIFNPETIERFAQHFSRLLPQTLNAPHRPLNDYAMLSESETQFVLNTVNATEQDFDTSQLLHQTFETQAARTPQNIAVTFEHTSITYDTLNRDANRLAHFLRSQGIGPDIPVGICIPRSISMITAVLAVLKAGGTYLPLDPTYPPDRLAYMLEDSEAPILLVKDSSQTIFDTSVRAKVVSLEDLQPTLKNERDDNLQVAIDPHNLLYLIYTSGSTGKPKGTGLSHHALRNLILWHWDQLQTPAATLQFASLSFDASFHEIFVALGVGATLVIASDEERQDVDKLVQCLKDNRIEKTILPVGIFQQWAAEYATRNEALPDLKEIITTGEQLIVTPSMRDLLEQMPQCQLHNHYGPSETHVITAYPFKNIPTDLTTPPPIGKPLANTQIYILDDSLNPTPQGIFGRLYAGGANLARGYHNRPDLTAERFIPSPFSDSGERLYDTGDIARYLPDGNIEFLGRQDAQLKIRGFRVEPGEVETTLMKHADIQQAAVVGLELQKHRKSLVAYYTTNNSQAALDIATLRTFVGNQLPDYMVPSRFIHLDAMPVTPSGKISRRSLPQPNEQEGESTQCKHLPVEPRHKLMAQIWEALIETQPIGIDENFFDLGGHSLLATRVVSRIRKEFGLSIELKHLFEYPTIESLTHHLAQEYGGPEVIDEIAQLSLNFDSMSEEERSALMAELEQE